MISLRTMLLAADVLAFAEGWGGFVLLIVLFSAVLVLAWRTGRTDSDKDAPNTRWRSLTLDGIRWGNVGDGVGQKRLDVAFSGDAALDPRNGGFSDEELRVFIDEVENVLSNGGAAWRPPDSGGATQRSASRK